MKVIVKAKSTIDNQRYQGAPICVFTLYIFFKNRIKYLYYFSYGISR